MQVMIETYESIMKEQSFEYTESKLKKARN